MPRCERCGHRHNREAACPTPHLAAVGAQNGAQTTVSTSREPDGPGGAAGGAQNAAPTNPNDGRPASAPAMAPAPAAAPRGLETGAAPPNTGGIDTLDDFYNALVQRHSGRLDRDVWNALQDITQASVGVDVEQPGWVGQLWDGVRYQRRIVPLIMGEALRSYKLTGWKWTTKPVMAPYTGNKADVPSNVVGTEPVETEAQRLAGAHDVDRKFRDFNDTAFFEAYYAAMTDSYARLSDAAAAAAIVAAATDIAVPAYSGFLGAIAAGVAAIDDDTNAETTFVLANKADVIPWVLATSESNKNVAELLRLIGVNIDRIRMSNSVTAGHVVTGTSAAIEFRELPGVPIRVEAIDMHKGGVDAGVFGYYATLLHDAGGLQDVVIAA